MKYKEKNRRRRPIMSTDLYIQKNIISFFCVNFFFYIYDKYRKKIWYFESQMHMYKCTYLVIRVDTCMISQIIDKSCEILLQIERI